MSKEIFPVLLCGGSGTRLWPLSRKSYPKQFVKLTGSQRPVGYIHADGKRSGVFLGSLMLGDDEGLVPYGQDKERDLVGTVERIGLKTTRLRALTGEQVIMAIGYPMTSENPSLEAAEWLVNKSGTVMPTIEQVELMMEA